MGTERTYSVFIAEDEVPARELLLDYLLARPELKLSGIARTGEDAYRKLSGGGYDLVLMDIHLPVMSGLEVLERLDEPPYVIFTTAHDRYAIRAFDVGAVDYLLKPFDEGRFNRSIEKFLNIRNADEKGEYAVTAGAGLSCRTGGKHHIVQYQDIIYVSSHGKSSVIHTVDGEIEIPLIIKEIEIKMPADSFIRIHKQHIVNIGYITDIEYLIGGQYLAYLKDEEETTLPVGRKYARLLKARLSLD